MVFTFTAINQDLGSVQDQILSSAIVPTLDNVFAWLLWVSFNSMGFESITLDSSALASNSQTNPSVQRRGWPRCNYCSWWGYTNEKCYKLHGRLTENANIAKAKLNHLASQFEMSTDQFSQPSLTLTGVD